MEQVEIQPLENWQDKERTFTVRQLRQALEIIFKPKENPETFSQLANEITLTLKEIRGEDVVNPS